MSDRNDSFALERNCTDAHRQGEEAAQGIATQAAEPQALGRLSIVKTAPLATLATTGDPMPARKSHLERLVEALRRSRRLQMAQTGRHHLHLVEEESN